MKINNQTRIKETKFAIKNVNIKKNGMCLLMFSLNFNVAMKGNLLNYNLTAMKVSVCL